MYKGPYIHNDWTWIDNSLPVTTTYKFIHDEGEKMSNLAKKYVNKNRDADEQRAIDEGLLGEDGLLTEAGKNLLFQILFAKHKTEFLKEVKELSEIDKEKK